MSFFRIFPPYKWIFRNRYEEEKQKIREEVRQEIKDEIKKNDDRKDLLFLQYGLDPKLYK